MTWLNSAPVFVGEELSTSFDSFNWAAWFLIGFGVVSVFFVVWWLVLKYLIHLETKGRD